MALNGRVPSSGRISGEAAGANIFISIVRQDGSRYTLGTAQGQTSSLLLDWICACVLNHRQRTDRQNVTARIRNSLGGAETLELNASIGTKTKSAYQASFTTPVLASPLLSFSLQGFSFDRDNTAFASHREEAKGGRAKLSVSHRCVFGHCSVKQGARDRG